MSSHGTLAIHIRMSILTTLCAPYISQCNAQWLVLDLVLYTVGICALDGCVLEYGELDRVGNEVLGNIVHDLLLLAVVMLLLFIIVIIVIMCDLSLLSLLHHHHALLLLLHPSLLSLSLLSGQCTLETGWCIVHELDLIPLNLITVHTTRVMMMIIVIEG